MKKLLLRILGILCVFLGVLGIFLPILPTTPFLLLASWAFLKSSEKLYHWLMNHPFLGLYIRSYLEYKGVSKTHKIMAILTLWLTMGISMILVDLNWVRGLLVLIGLGVTIHLLKLKTLTVEEMRELEELREEHSKEKSLKRIKE